jgi:hypothetical protein
MPIQDANNLHNRRTIFERIVELSVTTKPFMVNSARLILLLLTFLALGGEAATLGLGISASDWDQTHGASEQVEEVCETVEAHDGPDEPLDQEGAGVSTLEKLLAACPEDQEVPPKCGRATQGTFTWGHQRCHRWIGVDLN